MMRFRALSLRARLLVLVCLAVLPAAGIQFLSGLDRQREALQQSRQLVHFQSASVTEQHRRLVDSLHLQ